MHRYPHSNTKILSVLLQFVDLTLPQEPHIKEHLFSFSHLERANASAISQKLLESISDPLVGLDPSNICRQAYNGAAVMSSNRAGVQAKIKELAPLAMYTHCYSHYLNLSLASACKLQEVRNLVGVIINEVHLFLQHTAIF